MAKHTTQYLLRVDPDNETAIAQLTETRKATKFINQAIRFYIASLNKYWEYHRREPRRKDALATRLADLHDAIRLIRETKPEMTPEVQTALRAILDCLEIQLLPRSSADAREETLDDMVEAQEKARKAGISVTGPTDDLDALRP